MTSARLSSMVWAVVLIAEVAAGPLRHRLFTQANVRTVGVSSGRLRLTYSLA